MTQTLHQQFINSGKRTLQVEADAVNALGQTLDHAFAEACESLMACKGRIAVIGVGKSGHIGKKIAATFASTGSPAFFVHPSEASHGDLGMITPDDCVIMLSNSGNSAEVLALLPALRQLGTQIIAMVGRTDSTLARDADIMLNTSVIKEACPLNLAPTASTTASLAMGDALAVALLEARNFSREDFARSHPGGTLGRRLLLRVADVMRTGDEIPCIDASTNLNDALAMMSSKNLGMTTIVDATQTVLGVFTDGDLRRALDTGRDIHKASIGELMTRNPRTIAAETLAIQALETMESQKITTLIVANAEHRLQGVLHLHDLLRSGLV